MAAKKNQTDTRANSRLVVDGIKQAPSRAMLRAVGFTEADFSKPQIGVASTWANVTPCNMHIAELAREAAAGGPAKGGQKSVFHTTTLLARRPLRAAPQRPLLSTPRANSP